MKLVWISLILVATALAGCSEDAQDTDPETTPAIHGPTAGNQTAPANMTQPELMVSFNATLTEGDAPLETQFQFNATLANATWSLDVDNDGEPEATGSDLPGDHTFTYTVPGDYVANFTATFNGTSTWATLNITVSQGEPTVDPNAEFPDDPTCKTDTEAVEIPGSGLYITPQDLPLPYIYEESNGVPGLQRNDSAWDHDCQDPDTLHF